MHTLVVTLGSSPAIITETLWALFAQQHIEVDKVVVLTTEHGWNQLQQRILNFDDDTLGAYYQLCRVMGWPPHRIHFEGVNKGAVLAANGNRMYDIRSEADDAQFAESVFKTVKELTAEDAPPLIGLLSGGRKTMGTHLAAAFQFLARPGDRLIHTLVNEPYDRVPDFYFPNQPQQDLEINNQGLRYTIKAENAKITLLDTSFLRIRSVVPIHLVQQASYNDLLTILEKRLERAGQQKIREIIIDFEKSHISINDPEFPIRLNARELALFALFAGYNHLQQKICRLSWAEVIDNNGLLYFMHQLYRIAKIGTLSDMEVSYRQMVINDFERQDSWALWDHWHKGDKQIKNDFSIKRSQLIKKIKEGIVKHGIGAEEDVADVFRFESGMRNSLSAIHTIPIHPEYIQWVGLPENFWDDIREEL